MTGILIQGVEPNVGRILLEILKERERQDELFGQAAGFEDDPPHVHIAVLQKKLADFTVAVCQRERYFDHVKTRDAHQELIELAAVCVALLEVPRPEAS